MQNMIMGGDKEGPLDPCKVISVLLLGVRLSNKTSGLDQFGGCQPTCLPLSLQIIAFLFLAKNLQPQTYFLIIIIPVSVSYISKTVLKKIPSYTNTECMDKTKSDCLNQEIKCNNSKERPSERDP